jgi:hypothetical protein
MKTKSRPKRYSLRSLGGIGRFTFLVRVKAKKVKPKPEPRRTQDRMPKTIIGNIVWELRH